MSKNIDEVLYRLANFYTKRGQEGYKLDGSDYEGHTEAKQAILADLLSVMPEKRGETVVYGLFGEKKYPPLAYNEGYDAAIDEVTAAIKNYIKGE